MGTQAKIIRVLICMILGFGGGESKNKMKRKKKGGGRRGLLFLEGKFG